MIKITENEKDYLLSKGCVWHEDITASTTRRHYYAIASQKVRDLLDDYRQQIFVSSFVPKEP